MADINQVITLGIGTPGAIPEFLTFGLQIAQIAALTQPGLEYTFDNERMHFTYDDERIHTTFDNERIHYKFPDDD